MAIETTPTTAAIALGVAVLAALLWQVTVTVIGFAIAVAAVLLLLWMLKIILGRLNDRVRHGKPMLRGGN